jgi:hypothetical protein
VAVVRGFESAMSRVYSFRLSDNNPREAQARGVIEAWVEEGYSLRFLMTDALIFFSQKNGAEDLNPLMDYLEDFLEKFQAGHHNQTNDQGNSNLSKSFIVAVKNSAKTGLISK